MFTLRSAAGALAILALGASAPAAVHAKKVTLKIATLAPEGSTWWKLFMDAAKELSDRTDGRVRVRLYPGGVAGDEPDMVRKMRVGRLHGAAVTSVGLAEIEPAMLALQAPGLYQSWEELDHVRNALADRLAALLQHKGFRSLMWGDVGFNRVFAQVPVRMPQDLVGTKPWCWTQDGVFQAFYAAAGATPVLAGVPDVLPGLQTGRMDALTSPPLVVVSFQWFSHMKHMLALDQSVTIGAVVLAESALDDLSEEDRAALFEIGKAYTPKLAEAVRADNTRAVDAMRKAGIAVIEPDDAMRKAWAEHGRKAADAAAGTVYPKELLDEIRAAVAQRRAGGGK